MLLDGASIEIVAGGGAVREEVEDIGLPPSMGDVTPTGDVWPFDSAGLYRVVHQTFA